MEKYQVVFFDLDETLWDHTRNSAAALEQVWRAEPAVNRRTGAAEFWDVYNRENERLWAEYRAGRIEKETIRLTRFIHTLENFGLDDANLARQLSEAYLELYPRQPHLVDHARDVLDYLHGRYRLGILTNGFLTAQKTKLAAGGIAAYFRYFVNSEAVGHPKPHPAMYETAVRQGGAAREATLIIGDDLENDILGAKKCGLPAVYFNPCRRPHRADPAPDFEITSLTELKKIL